VLLLAVRDVRMWVRSGAVASGTGRPASGARRVAHARVDAARRLGVHCRVGECGQMGRGGVGTRESRHGRMKCVCVLVAGGRRQTGLAAAVRSERHSDVAARWSACAGRVHGSVEAARSERARAGSKGSGARGREGRRAREGRVGSGWGIAA